MPNFLSNLLEQIRGIWNNLTLARKTALVLVGIAILAGLIALIFMSNRLEYKQLYSNLSSEDLTSIEMELDNMGMPYQNSEDSKTISVPQDRVREARMRLASRGLPRSESVGFELFDENRFGMTNFAQHVQYQRALQGELAKTIIQIDSVSSARVHLVIPQPSVFIEEEKPAKASVLLKINPGEKLSSDQVNGIVHLVASAVEGLSAENVELIDTANGVLLNREDKSLAESVSEQLKYRHAVEESYRNRILSALSPVLGPSRLTAWVSVEMDFDSFEITKEEYDPYTNIIKSEQRTKESTERLAEVVGGTPGMASNLNVNTATNTQNPGASQTQNNILQSRIPLKETKEDSTISYVVGKSVLHTKRSPGHINRITASVVVDNKQKAGTKQSQPWTVAELQNIESIIKSAIGYNPARGDVVEVKNVPFAISELPVEKEVIPEVEQRRHLYKTAAQLVFGLIVVVFAYFMILRPIFRGVGKLVEIPEAEKPQEIPVPEEEGEKAEELIERITPAISTEESTNLEALRKLAEESPEKIEGLVLHWLEEEI